LIEFDIGDIGDLNPDPKNARVHSDRNKKAIMQSLGATGSGRSIVIDETDTILAGNGVAEVAASMGLNKVLIVDGDRDTLIAVRRSDLTPEEKVKLALYDNRAGELAEWDAGILESISKDDPELTAAMFDKAEWSKLMSQVDRGEPQDPEPQIDKAEELRVKWGVNLGDMYEIGPHRIICGDCTDPAVVARVMGRERAELVVTDPPYGVSYGDKNKFLNSRDGGHRIETPIEGDQGNMDDIRATWKAAFLRAYEVMAPGAVLYSFMPQGGRLKMTMLATIDESGIEPRHELIWVKNNHVLGRVDYAYKHEPILYAWKEGGHKFYGDFQTSVLEFAKPQSSDMHPTTKPVELIERLVSNSSLQGAIVFDPFLGSGTTILACQNQGRKGRGCELSPAYVAVALERLAQMGLEPRLIGGQE